MIQEPSLLSQEESGFLTLFQDFLAAHADPEGGHRLHALYAEEAPVALEGRLLREGKRGQATCLIFSPYRVVSWGMPRIPRGCGLWLRLPCYQPR